MEQQPEVAKKVARRVFILDSIDPTQIGLGFFSTNTGVNVNPSIEDHFLTVGVAKFAVAELFLRLRELIAANPKDYGFKTVEDFKNNSLE